MNLPAVIFSSKNRVTKVDSNLEAINVSNSRCRYALLVKTLTSTYLKGLLESLILTLADILFRRAEQ